MSLFEKPEASYSRKNHRKGKPLADRMRPEHLAEMVGQKHLLDEGKALRALIESGHLVSMILWGPPGTGKTTLARIIAKETQSRFVQLSAVDAGVSDVRRVIQDAAALRSASAGRFILFIDEIHRFNKSQQDALLHAVEDGTITLIGATTENPSFEIIGALLSRCKIFRLEELRADELKLILDRALKEDEWLMNKKVLIEDIDSLIFYSGGDARNLLNTLEICLELAQPSEKAEYRITREMITEAYQRKNIPYDWAGEMHYDTISAFIKSIRGSDPDAALYYMARMLEGGEDPKFIARRMIVLASEDIGNADVYALTLAVSAFTAVDYIGMPEARIVLAQCATYLACCPKSNAAYMGIEAAYHDVRNEPLYPIPLHLRNPVTGLMKTFRYGEGYKYAHDYQDRGEPNFADQIFLPETLKDRIYYKPTENGSEKRLKERLLRIWPGKRKKE